jgi:hypothetical protein
MVEQLDLPGQPATVKSNKCQRRKTMPNEFDPARGGLLGTNDLQQVIDKFSSAVTTLSSTVNQMSSTSSNGMTRSPAMSANADGATFSSQPGMGAMWGGGIGLSGPRGAWAATAGPNQWFSGGATPGFGGGVPAASGQGAPTLGQLSAGGGANGGGASGLASLPQGALPQGNYSSGAGPALPNGNMTYGAGGGAYSKPPAAGGGGFASMAVPAAMQATGWMMNSGMGQLSNQLLFNAYGTQMQAQWGGSAQSYQNAAFGNGINGANNYAAAGNAQSAAAEFGTLTQMAGGANVTSTAAFGATNALAMTNQGLGAAGAAQLAAQIYNPQRALQQQLLTGVSAFGPNGQQASLASQISGLANEGYLGGGNYDSKTGTFKQSSLNASFTAGRGTSYMNLQSLGYSSSQIQDIQSMMSQANQIATAGHTSLSNVLDTMNQAEYGTGGQNGAALGQLHKWDSSFKLSTIQNQGNLSSVNLGQQQNQSSTYNDAVNDFTNVMSKATQAMNWFLDKTGLGKLVGGVQGSTTAMQTTGISGWVSGISHMFATGGVVPGYSPGVDNHIIAVSGGEGILTPEATQAVGGASFVNALNKRYAGHRGGGSGSSQTHFADGGIVTSSDGDSNLGLTVNADSTLFSGGGGGGGLTLASGRNTTTTNGGSGGKSSNGGSGSSTNGGSAGSTRASGSELSWIRAFLKDVNAPDAAANIASVTDWISHEKPPGNPLQWNNPLNIGTPGSDSTGRIGTYPVGPGIAMYDTPTDGAHADADFLLQNGYPQILSLLREGKGLKTGAAQDLLKWSGGGYSSVETGGTVIVGERGPEAITLNNGTSANVMNAKDTANLLRGSTARPAQAPYTSSPAAQYLLDALTPANQANGNGGGGVSISVTVGPNAINIGGSSGFNSNVNGDVYTAGQQLAVAVARELEGNALIRNIANGVTG